MGDFDPADEAFASFRNRHDLKVFVKIITPTDRPIRGNAFLAHGFSDVHDTGHMRALTSAGVRSGYRVIVWDATHSWGRRSEGEPGEATFYYHHADLEDVLEWSHTQAWYERQFVLMGFKPGRYDGRRVCGGASPPGASAGASESVGEWPGVAPPHTLAAAGMVAPAGSHPAADSRYESAGVGIYA